LPSHNRAPILQKVLEHIEMLEYDFADEIIVIDNNSQDDSVKMVRSKFPGVRLVGLEKNLGAVSRNIGISTARGKYIVMLDDDSYPCPGTVDGGIRIFETDIDHKIGCIAFNIRQEDGSYETSGIYTHFTGCGAMFHSDAFRQIGEYPQDYLYYAEEYDLSCRIWNHGLKILNFKELEVVHLKTVMNRDFEKIICQLVRNNIMLWSKYLPMEHEKGRWYFTAEICLYGRIQGIFNGHQKNTRHRKYSLSNKPAQGSNTW
ncbi:MAG: glycosyltransferase, partial [Desulfosarcinaceae bacterium]